MNGGGGSDTFVWQAGDEGTTDTPATDTITDFDLDRDVIDLSDLLPNATAENITDYIFFSNSDGGNTTHILIATGGNEGQADQIIKLEGITYDDLGGSSRGDMLDYLIGNGNLVLADSADAQGTSAAAFSMEGLFSDEARSEEHTSELQSRFDLVCLLL